MLKLGSHNSWSFGKTKWYIPSFICKCQKSTIQQQYLYGVRLFDLRLRLDKDLIWKAAHGSAFFDVDYIKDLEFLNRRSFCFVRVILEYNSEPKHKISTIEYFKAYCSFLERRYSNIKFFGGNAKWNWEQIYKFKNEDPELIDLYSSTTSWFKSNNKFLRIIDDWWPWLYAKFHNKKNYERYLKSESDKWFFIDFVNMV